MDLTALQSFVDKEVAELGPGYPKPLVNEPSGDDDERLGEVPDDLKLLFGRTQELGDQSRAIAGQEQVKCDLHVCTEEGHAEARAKMVGLIERRNQLSDIFWMTLKKRLGVAGHSVELKSDWQVVVSPDKKEEPEQVIDVIDIIAIGGPPSRGVLASLFRRFRED